MASSDMATVTASLERSFQNFSLNTHQGEGSGSGSGSESDSRRNVSADGGDDAPRVELNSQGPLPLNWEQCLDLKTGEIYYINWRTGKKVKDDPRRATAATSYTAVADDYSGDDSSSCDSDDSGSESSPSSSRQQWSAGNNYYSRRQQNVGVDVDVSATAGGGGGSGSGGGSVLVVAGCKRCLMYYMVPKQEEICPKCCGHLLHFDRSGNASSSSS
ncbi:protein CURLY FLAG LEAF 1-like [Andrographis paniculata]|uniref:protein CURLY FLAG LEAF 1-like n=1 Tax=Andrographis paniculata TaxID=175694 RepID=UPI0021E975D8|nr:protein CURLY FLAG LEAF 1-like [Andrographis paniculata]